MMAIAAALRRTVTAVAVALAGAACLSGGHARADTLIWALSQAYVNNPQLNSQRAITRAIDENVPQALSGYRPTVTANGTFGGQYQRTVTVQAGRTSITEGEFTPRSVGITGTQTLFNGFQTGNKVRQAEQQVSAARETLRLIEQNVLLSAATAYMNLLRDTAILDLQRKNVEVLTEQLRQTRDRFAVGEVTRTDVAQAESRLAAGRSQVAQAESNYNASRAIYPERHRRHVRHRCAGPAGQDQRRHTLSDPDPGRQREPDLGFEPYY
jgi:outer membrane protein